MVEKTLIHCLYHTHPPALSLHDDFASLLPLGVSSRQ